MSIKKLHNVNRLGGPHLEKVTSEKVNEIIDALNALTPSYKVYRALLTQSSTSAPVATVLENTLGGTVTWARQNTGDYLGTLTGAFPELKTALSISGSFNIIFASGNKIPSIYWNDANSVGIYTNATNTADSILNDTLVEIRVYN